MTHKLETHFTPIVQPTDPASVPTTHPRGLPVLAPLRPDRRGRPRGARWLRRASATRPVWGHFCLPDPMLLRLARDDPLGLRLSAEAGVTAAVTMDTPLYAFMSPAQVARSHAQHLHRLIRSMESFPRRGIQPIPLVKGLDAATIDAQLDLLQELGAHDAAFYARELLLEHDVDPVRRFVRGCHRRRLAPTLLGAVAPSATRWGPVRLAGMHPYVLARRNAWLPRIGPARPLQEMAYLSGARRFVSPGDVQGLVDHNYAITAARIEGTLTTRIGG